MENLFNKKGELTTEGIEKIISNPFYCCNINENLIEKHEPLISEDLWIKANTKIIQEIGAEKFLKRLLENLK